jgi:hypothetical protein
VGRHSKDPEQPKKTDERTEEWLARLDGLNQRRLEALEQLRVQPLPTRATSVMLPRLIEEELSREVMARLVEPMQQPRSFVDSFNDEHLPWDTQLPPVTRTPRIRPLVETRHGVTYIKDEMTYYYRSARLMRYPRLSEDSLDAIEQGMRKQPIDTHVTRKP